MRPTRTIVTVLLAATVAVTGCSARPTTHPAGVPTGPPAPSPTLPPAPKAPPTPPTPPPQVGTWQRLPAAPIPGGSYTGVWTGSELLVEARVADYSGSVPERRIVGAAYNPATRSWRMLPPGPVPTQALGDDNAVWTGHELLTWGMGLGASYNPATNRWRTIATGSLGSPAVTVWTGRQLLVWGGQTVRGGAEVTPPHGVAYDPASNRWSALPVSPLHGRTGHVAVWTGTALLVWGGFWSNPGGRGRVFADGAAYTPAAL